MNNIEEILNDSILREELIKCLKYRLINRDYLPFSPIVEHFCSNLWDIDFQYTFIIYLINNYKDIYREILNLISEFFFQNLVQIYENLDTVYSFSEEDNSLYNTFEDVLKRDFQEADEYVKNIESLISRTENRDIKGIIYRKLSWIEKNEHKKIKLLKEALENCSDDLERKLIYYELLQLLVFNGDEKELEIYLSKAKEEFPEEEMFYEIYGHLGMFYMENENTYLAKKYLEYVYEWLVYESLNETIKNISLNGNFLVFLTVLAKIYEDEDKEKARHIYSFTFHLIRSYIHIIYENEPKSIRPILEENLNSFLSEYAYFNSSISGEKPEDVFNILKSSLKEEKNFPVELKKAIDRFKFD